MKQIVVTFDLEGHPTVEAKGFQGTECLAATKALEAALGGEVTSRTPKPEMAKRRTVVRQGNGA